MQTRWLWKSVLVPMIDADVRGMQIQSIMAAIIAWMHFSLESSHGLRLTWSILVHLIPDETLCETCQAVSPPLSVFVFQE